MESLLKSKTGEGGRKIGNFVRNFNMLYPLKVDDFQKKPIFPDLFTLLKKM